MNAALAPCWSANLGAHRACDPHRCRAGLPLLCPHAAPLGLPASQADASTHSADGETRALGQGLGLGQRGVPHLTRLSLSFPILPVGALSVTSECHSL